MAILGFVGAFAKFDARPDNSVCAVTAIVLSRISTIIAFRAADRLTAVFRYAAVPCSGITSAPAFNLSR